MSCEHTPRPETKPWTGVVWFLGERSHVFLLLDSSFEGTFQGKCAHCVSPKGVEHDRLGENPGVMLLPLHYA